MTNLSATAVCRLDDLTPETPLRVELDGAGGPVAIAVVRTNDNAVYAINDICSHERVSLSDGDVDGCTIECWLHGSRFDLRTGEPSGLPATKPVPVYPVTVTDGEVFVDLMQ